MIPFEPFRVYWRVYGGWKALLKSIYLWTAVILTAVCFPLWSDEGFISFDDRPVTDTLFTVIPGLMAFTLAGMAIVLALSGAQFIKAIREGGKEDSLFMRVVALFFHFILVQTLALTFTFVSASYPERDWIAGVAFFFATYGVASAVSIAAMLLNVSRVFNVAGDDDDDPA